MSSKNVNSFSTIGIIDTYSNSSLLGIVSGNLTRLTSGNLVLNQVNASNLIYNTGNQIKSGRLVIGDTTVDASYPYTLSLQTNSSSTFLEILNNGGANKGVFFGIAGNDFEQYNWQGGDIRFFTSENPSDGTERLIIKNDGKVGIGTSALSEKLQVAGNIKASGANFNYRPTVNGTGVLLSGEASAIVLPNTLVYTTGDQTISGIKTFIAPITAPNLVYTSGDQTISGNKIFTGDVEIQGIATIQNLDLLMSNYFFNAVNIDISNSNVNVQASGTLSITGNVYANNLVYNTGNQTISGIKTFASRPTVNGTGFLLTGEAVGSNGSINSIIRLTQAQYNSLSPKDPNTFYVIVG